MAPLGADSVVNALRRATLNMRLNRMRHFVEIMKPSAADAILDVGGYHEQWRQCGYEGPVVFLNLEPPEKHLALCPLPANCRYVQGDGRHMEFADQDFDIIFSNSVIEHVGGWEDQKAFAREIARVGKRYWIQTPNRHFPMEPHFLFPCFQYMPLGLREVVGQSWPFSFPKRDGYDAEAIRRIVREIRLLNVREMREIFPDADIWKEQFAGLAKSIVAYKC